MTMLQDTQPTTVPESQPQNDPPLAVPRRRFSLRGFTSLLLTLSSLAMLFSGAMLFLTPRGRTANWTDWSLLGLTKQEWGAVHVNNSILFVVIAIIHLVLNWSVLMRYIKKKTATGLHMKKELALATAVAAVCIVGPIWSVPPFSTVMLWNEDIKDYWDANAQQPPVAHAEDLTIAELADTIQLSVEDVSTALEDEGYDVQDSEQTIAEIAEQKGVAPSEMVTAIRNRYPETRGWGRVGGRGGPNGSAGGPGRNHGAQGAEPGRGSGGEGFGRGRGSGRGQGWSGGETTNVEEVTVSSVASAVGLTVDEVLAALFDAGLNPENGETTLGQLSSQHSQTPEEILDAIRERFPDTRGWGRITGQRGGGWH